MKNPDLKIISIILSDYTDQPASELEDILEKLWDCELIEEYISDNYPGNVAEVCMHVLFYYIELVD